MRCSHPERARTFLFTTLLFVLSFTATLADSANVHGYRAHHAWRRRAPLDAIPRDVPTTLTSQDLPVPSITSALQSVLPTVTTPSTSLSLIPVPSLTTSSSSTPSPTSLSATNPTTTPSSSSSSTPTPSTSSTTSTTIPTTSSGNSLSQSTVSQSSSQSSSSQSSSTAKPSTSAAAAAVGATTVVTFTSATPVYSEPATSYATGTTTSSTPSSTSSSNSGFFSNTGAVAGTFTIAGLLSVAGIIGAGMLIARRRASRSYEDDMEYLEKRPEPAIEPSQSQNFVVGDAEDSSDMDHFGNSMEVTVPPAAHFYSQQDVYFAHGQTANTSEGYEDQGYYPQETYAPHDYGIAYPPMEPYVAEDAYGGMDEAYAGMPNPFGESELPASLRPSGQQPQTLNLPPSAYRPQDLHHSLDSFYGSSTGASHGHVM